MDCTCQEPPWDEQYFQLLEKNGLVTCTKSDRLYGRPGTRSEQVRIFQDFGLIHIDNRDSDSRLRSTYRRLCSSTAS